MARQWVLKNNLSSGELSPLLWTRTDVQQYANGAKKLLNALPLVEGGVKKRPGTRYRMKTSNVLRLIPFISSSENTFLIMLSIGHLYIYDPRLKAVTWDAPTPYDTAQKVREVQYAHTGFRMYFVQGDTPVHRLLSSADFSAWSFAPFSFGGAPTLSSGTTYNFPITPSAIELGKTISLTAGAYAVWSNTEQYKTGDRVRSSSTNWEATTDNTGETPHITNANWKHLPGATQFDASFVGSVIAVNGGLVKITEYKSATVLNGEVVQALTTNAQAIARSWSVKPLAFSTDNGYPKAVCFFKQRLVFANTKANPNLIWMSAVGDDGNFIATSKDADAIIVASSSSQSDNILHLAQRGGIVALTGGSEFLIDSTGALTPSTVQIAQHTAYGAQKDVRPCQVGNELLFVQRGGDRLRALMYDFQADGLVSPEISAVAPHIADDHHGIREMTYQQTPNSVVWIVLNDGRVASITLNREQNMNAWAQHDFGCSVLSMCSLPTTAGSDLCFMLTDRNGSIFLEEVLEEAQSDCEFEIYPISVGVESDSEKLIDPIYNWNGAEGYFYQDHFEQNELPMWLGQPFEFEVQLLPPDFSQVPTTTMFHKISVHEAVVYLHKSLGGELNGRTIEHKQNNQFAFFNHLFTGYSEVALTGWNPLYQFELSIKHNKPLPFHVQSISMLVSMNEK